MQLRSTMQRVAADLAGARRPRRRRDSHAGAACLTLAFSVGISVLYAAAPSPPNNQAAARQAQEQAGWASLEAERRATDGDYDGAVQAQQEADRDRTAAQRLPKEPSTVR